MQHQQQQQQQATATVYHHIAERISQYTLPSMHPSMYSAGELTNDEVEAIVAVMKNPLNHKIPKWFLNRQKDVKTGKFEQIISNGMQGKLREDLERLKKMRYDHSLPCQCK